MDLSMDGMPVDVNQSILDVESPKRGNPWTIAEWQEALRIDRCDREIAACQACVADETNPLSDRVGAMLGEFDWKFEKALIEQCPHGQTIGEQSGLTLEDINSWDNSEYKDDDSILAYYSACDCCDMLMHESSPYVVRDGRALCGNCDTEDTK